MAHNSPVPFFAFATAERVGGVVAAAAAGAGICAAASGGRGSCDAGATSDDRQAGNRGPPPSSGCAGATSDD